MTTSLKDLYFRLGVAPVQLPPLRERPEDIMVFAQYFLHTEAQSLNAGRVFFLPEALAALYGYEWPGNVRELQNRICRALPLFNGQTITQDDLGLDTCQPDQTVETLFTLQKARNQAEQHCVRKALMMTGNNISQAAKLLKISRPTLHDLLKKHDIKSYPSIFESFSISILCAERLDCNPVVSNALC